MAHDDRRRRYAKRLMVSRTSTGAAVEIIRRMTVAEGELPEGVLVEAADALFCKLDVAEAANVRP